MYKILKMMIFFINILHFIFLAVIILSISQTSFFSSFAKTYHLSYCRYRRSHYMYCNKLWQLSLSPSPTLRFIFRLFLSFLWGKVLIVLSIIILNGVRDKNIIREYTLITPRVKAFGIQMERDKIKQKNNLAIIHFSIPLLY